MTAALHPIPFLGSAPVVMRPLAEDDAARVRERELVLSAQQGAHDAFAELVRQH